MERVQFVYAKVAVARHD